MATAMGTNAGLGLGVGVKLGVGESMTSVGLDVGVTECMSVGLWVYAAAQTNRSTYFELISLVITLGLISIRSTACFDAMP